MYIVFEQVFILALFAFAGYALCKFGLADSRHSKLLSCLEVYLFLPCLTFKTFSKNMSVVYIKEKYEFIIVSAVILAVLIVMGTLLSRCFAKNEYERKIYKYSLIIPNYGYMGYALADSLFGSEALLNMMVFAIPVSLYTNSVGYCMLTNSKISLKNLGKPPILALLAGSLVGLSAVRIPPVLLDFCDKSGNCMAPVSMVLTGMVLAETDIKKLLRDRRNYVMSLLRLLLIPCSIAGVLSLFCSREMVAAALLLYASPCGLNTIVFPRMINENCEIGEGLVCVSTVVACITIPLCIQLFLS